MKTFENFKYDDITSEINHYESVNDGFQFSIDEIQLKVDMLEDKLSKFTINPDVYYKRYPDAIEELKAGVDKIKVMNKYQIDHNILDKLYTSMTIRKKQYQVEKLQNHIKNHKEQIDKNLEHIKKLKARRDSVAPITIPGTERKYDI